MLPAGTRAAVLTGDIQTDNDARRLGRYGYPVRQITTAGACHLDARMVENHLTDWLDERLDLLLIENVGNLVCPTSYDLGEDAKIVVLSVTEGEDKPLKYPGHFSQSGIDDLEQDRSAALCSLRSATGAGKTRGGSTRALKLSIHLARPGPDWSCGSPGSPAARKTKSAAFRAEEVGHVVVILCHRDTDVSTVLARRGISRRQLVKFCSAMLAHPGAAGTLPGASGRRQWERPGSRCWSGCSSRTARAARNRCCARATPMSPRRCSNCFRGNTTK